ncbi:hypothetical protein NKJ09_23015 [Mesorhizobium sp. M0189]|uniref:hypothetical protein n=1 Tax=Mesorhizobium sp. M0189 TaxID=2956909 RepID=UPI00333D1F35
MDAITQQLRAAQKPITRCLWTEADAITFTPSVLEQTFGDGLALFAVTTINNRPAYWIVRGCSTWSAGDGYRAPDDAPEFGDMFDEVLTALEDEFGSTSCYERNRNGIWIDQETKKFIPQDWAEYPTVNDECGCSWWRLDWPDLEGVTFAPHPFAKYRILAAINNGGR